MSTQSNYKAQFEDVDFYVALSESISSALSHTWSALPAYVVRYVPETLTVDLQPTIQGRITKENGEVELVNLPVLLDVPVVFPHAGGCSLTFPIKEGDECLVIFADRCIDGWWADGGVQPPFSARKHDLSDGFAICGVWSQATKLNAPSTEAVELRSDDHEAYLSIHPMSHEINVKTSSNYIANVSGNTTINVGGSATINVSSTTQVTCPSITVKASESVKFETPLLQCTGLIQGLGGLSISGSSGSVSGAVITGDLITTGDVIANQISLEHHVHSNVSRGGDDTGAPK